MGLDDLFEFISGGADKADDTPKAEAPKVEVAANESELESLTRVNQEIRSAHANESDIPIQHVYWKNKQRLFTLHKGLK